jgi:exodeoxyribonuclease VII large subunit
MSFVHNQPEYSVSEIAGHVKRMVEETFGYVRVRGELSKVGINAASGHAYITMKDDKAVLEAVCWKGTLARLAHKPEAGMEVIATGKLTTYPGASKYQLVIESLEPAGIGALMAMLEKRKKALAAEGLFDEKRKKPIPFLPQTIGIITSPTGAVIRDMLHRLSDRFPRHVLLWPVPVQGEGAAEKIAAAIRGFNSIPEGGLAPHPRHEDGVPPAASGSLTLRTETTNSGASIPRPDLLIVARGGGSIEDLWAFNEEVVVRAAAASAIPLISAVGHETDTTLIDYASDKRAPTPTAAAELAVPVREELLGWIEQLGATHSNAVRKMITYYRERVEGLSRGLPRPQQLVATMEQALDGLSERLLHALPRSLQMRHERLQRLAAGLSPRLLREMLLRQEQRVQHIGAMLESLNVLAVLKRGFVLVKDAGGVLVTSAAAMPEHAALTLQFHDGARAVASGNATPVVPTERAKKPCRKKPDVEHPTLFD